MPVCIACNQTHDLSGFNKDRSRKTGHDPRCKTCTRQACRQVYRKYNEKHKALKLRWKRENPERRAEINREWQKDNPDLVRLGTSRYRKRLAQATPAWADRAAITRFRAARPEGHHVDHIVPLAGENVSGLNVPWNLQYLPAEVHRKKGNRFVEAEGVCYL